MIVASTIAGVLLLSGVTVFAIKQSGQKKVVVASVQELTSFGGDMNPMNLSGTITSDVSQEVRLTNEQVIDEIYVKEGDTVKIGDKLLSYDMTLVNLELEMKKLDKQGVELNIKKAKRELEKLKKTKPSASEPPVMDIPDFPQEPMEPEEPNIPEEPSVPEEPNIPEKPDVPVESVSASEILDETSKPYMGSGTVEDPFHYLVSQKGIVKGSFLNQMAKNKSFFLIEVRQGDKSLGELMKVWGQNISGEGFQADPEAEYDLSLGIRKNKEKSLPPWEKLTDNSVTNEEWIAGNGTAADPYVFLVQKNGTVFGSFFNRMKEKKAYFRIEVRQGDKQDGILLKAWEQNGGLLENVSEDDVFLVNIEKQSSQQKPDVSPEVTPTPTPSPEKPVTPEPTPAPTPEITPTPTPETHPTPEVTPIPEPTPEPETTPVPSGEKELNHETDSSDQQVWNNRKIPKVVKTAKRTVEDMMGSMEGMSAEEIKKAIKAKEEEIRGYQLDLKEVEVELKQMEKNLENQIVTSNLNGVVKTVGDPEQPAMDGSPLIFVAGSDGLYVTGNVSEMQLDKVKKGTVLNGFSYENGVSFTAEIQDVSPYPIQESYENNNSSAYPFTAYISEADGLKNYSWVELSLEDTGESMNNGIVIDKAFVRSENGKYYVMLDNGKGRLKKQYVKVTKVVWGSSYEIAEGLTLEDKIAFPYGKHVVEGAKTEEGSSSDLYQ